MTTDLSAWGLTPPFSYYLFIFSCQKDGSERICLTIFIAILEIVSTWSVSKIIFYNDNDFEPRNLYITIRKRFKKYTHDAYMFIHIQ